MDSSLPVILAPCRYPASSHRTTVSLRKWMLYVQWPCMLDAAGRLTWSRWEANDIATCHGTHAQAPSWVPRVPTLTWRRCASPLWLRREKAGTRCTVSFHWRQQWWEGTVDGSRTIGASENRVILLNVVVFVVFVAGGEMLQTGRTTQFSCGIALRAGRLVREIPGIMEKPKAGRGCQAVYKRLASDDVFPFCFSLLRRAEASISCKAGRFRMGRESCDSVALLRELDQVCASDAVTST